MAKAIKAKLRGIRLVCNDIPEKGDECSIRRFGTYKVEYVYHTERDNYIALIGPGTFPLSVGPL